MRTVKRLISIHIKRLKKEIQENDYNLNIPRYVETFEEEAPVDMEAVKQNIADIKKELAVVEVEMEKYLKELGL